MTEAKTANPGGRPRKFEERPHFNTALEYAMHVINDSTVTARRRDAMAMHVLRTIEGPASAQAPTKQAERKEAAIEAATQFTVPPAPERSQHVQ
jgi:hypothetical protein